MSDGFGYWPATSTWGVSAYLQGKGWISGTGRSSGSVTGSYINVSGTGSITAGTNTGTAVSVAGYTTVSGTASLTPTLRGIGSLSGYTNNLSGSGWVTASGSGSVNVSGTAQVSVVSPSTLAADDQWSASVRGVGQVRGSGTTTGNVRGTLLMTGARTSGVGIGYGLAGLYTYPRYSLTAGQADAVGTTSISTNYTGFTEVSGTVTSSAAGSKSGRGTVSGIPTIWASGFGSTNLTGENVRVRI